MDTINKNRGNRLCSILLFAFFIVGILSGSYLVYKRVAYESNQNHIENIMNYDAVLRLASFEKEPVNEIFKEVKDSGVTALAIYDTTLEKLRDRGDIIIIHGGNTADLYFSNTKRYGTPGKTYVLAAPGKEVQFKETWNALIHRYGSDKVLAKQTNRGLALELSQPYKSLKEANLGISRSQALDVVHRGFNVIVRPTNYSNENLEDIKYTLDQLEGVPRITGMVFVGKEVLGYPNDLGYVENRLKEMHIPIVGIESTSQLQYEPQAGFLQMAKDMHYQVGRLYTISPDYLKKLNPERVGQMIYISDLERNVRYNLLPIFERGYDNQTALKSTLSYVKTLKEKLESRHMVLGRASIYPDYYPSTVLLILTMLGAVALFVFTTTQLVYLRKEQEAILFAVLALGSILVYALTNGVLIRQIWAFLTAVVAPVNAIIVCMNLWKKKIIEEKKTSLSALIAGVVYSFIAFLLAFMGGIFIGAILGSNDFFMEFSIYRGVKATFILPIILAVIAYLERFPLWKNSRIDSMEKAKSFLKEILQSNVKVYTLIVLGALLIVAWIFIGRSGNASSAPVPHFEVAMRHYLENIMFARPREKEFLIGYPSMFIAIYALWKKWPTLIHFIFVIGATIGLGSEVETFAHIRTPIIMSLIRGIDGLLAGIGVAIIALIFIILGEGIYKRLIGPKEAKNE